jgi:hypothetical protein
MKDSERSRISAAEVSQQAITQGDYREARD